MADGHRWPTEIPSRIRPIAVIGEGVSGTVWRARDTERGRDVAVKVVVARPGVTPDPGARLEIEGRALARLRGVTGVLAVHEVGRCRDGTGWLVCDLATGGTLADRVALGPVEHGELAAVGVRIGTALAGAHRLGVVHGDVTPSNILLVGDGDGDGEGAVLADFAMATLGALSDAPDGFTPAFAAPERIHGAAATPASDVYGLAASLAWALGHGTGGGGPVPAGVHDLLDAARSEHAGRRPSAETFASELATVAGR